MAGHEGIPDMSEYGDLAPTHPDRGSKVRLADIDEVLREERFASSTRERLLDRLQRRAERAVVPAYLDTLSARHIPYRPV
jgi:hypothetical protein